jgi:hypothetical protein
LAGRWELGYLRRLTRTPGEQIGFGMGHPRRVAGLESCAMSVAGSLERDAKPLEADSLFWSELPTHDPFSIPPVLRRSNRLLPYSRFLGVSTGVLTGSPLRMFTVLRDLV